MSLPLLGAGYGLGTGSGPTGTATWDATTATAVTLSGGDLVATNTGTTSNSQGVKVATASGKSGSGQYYFEITLTNLASTGASVNTSLGITQTAVSYATIASSGAGALVLNQNGNIFSNGSGAGAIGQRATGNVICLAIDFTNSKAWFRVGAAGNWNNGVIGSQNPATNTGGSNIAALTGTLVPYVAFGGTNGLSGNILTANFGASAFTGTPPSGFTSGWPA